MKPQSMHCLGHLLQSLSSISLRKGACGRYRAHAVWTQMWQNSINLPAPNAHQISPHTFSYLKSTIALKCTFPCITLKDFLNIRFGFAPNHPPILPYPWIRHFSWTSESVNWNKQPPPQLLKIKTSHKPTLLCAT